MELLVKLYSKKWKVPERYCRSKRSAWLCPRVCVAWRNHSFTLLYVTIQATFLVTSTCGITTHRSVSWVKCVSALSWLLLTEPSVPITGHLY